MSATGNAGAKRLESSLDAFRKALEVSNSTLQSILETTTPSDLSDFFQQQDKTRQPSLNLTANLFPIKKVFDLTYEAGHDTWGLEETLLRQLYGSLRCVLMVGHNVYKDMPNIARLLEEIGRSIQIDLNQDHDSRVLLDCMAFIGAEIVRFCTIYISQGPNPETYVFSNTIGQIRHAQTIMLTQPKVEKKIRQWLSPPDPSTNFNAAIKQRQENTGSWFLESGPFLKWTTDNDSFLWLYGKPGCGKTMLCSTVIEYVNEHYRIRHTQAVVYFYFAFSDIEKQSRQNMVHSVIIQLLSQCREPPREIYGLYSSCNDGTRQPSDDALMKVLHQLIKGFDKTFIILDALDECQDRGELLECLTGILEWKLGSLHLMVTSRPEKDIQDFIEPLLNEDKRICIESALVNDDIRAYVRHRIQNDVKLKRWRKQPDVQQTIETRLMEKVDGMFRWAVCQLDSLETCLNLTRLQKALRSLPRTLDETYARILSNIDEDYQSDALKILQWLVNSARPLRIEEIVEVLAIEINLDPGFDPTRRFPEPRDILSVCSSLITIVPLKHKGSGMGKIEVNEVKLAHFSVQEYLISDRICKEVEIYRIEKISTNAAIAEACLVYLHHFINLDPLPSDILERFPLAQYAAEYWMSHAKVVDREPHPVISLSMEIFNSDKAYLNWLLIFNSDKQLRLQSISDARQSGLPLYYTSYGGLLPQTMLLLKKGADINAQGGFFGFPLLAAAFVGHKAIVRLLLENGANINLQNDDAMYSSPLMASVLQGREAIIRLLLNNGANVNLQNGNVIFSSPLIAAIEKEREAIIQLLLDNGANVNLQNGNGAFSSPLMAAIEKGREAIIRLLLNNGANVNLQNGNRMVSSPLVAAVVKEHEAIIRLLLDNGANVNNSPKDRFDSALKVAAKKGEETIVKLLMQKGAVSQADYHNNALAGAAGSGHEAIVKLLLEGDGNVNGQGESFYLALWRASNYGHEDVVRLLLEKNAGIDDDKTVYFTHALEAAARNKHVAAIKILLEKNVHVKAQRGVTAQGQPETEDEHIARLLSPSFIDDKELWSEYNHKPSK